MKDAAVGSPPTPSVNTIPTMVSSEELEYLASLAPQTDGDVLEIGPWLGATTWALASGMAGDRQLHVVDTFRWRRYMEARAPLGLADGASFRPAFERYLRPFADRVVIHEARLPDDFESDVEFAGQPVLEHGTDLPLFKPVPAGLVFVDGAKSWTAMKFVMSILRPGAIVVLQDYQYWANYYVVIAAAMARSSLEVRDVLPFNSVAFRVIDQIDVGNWPELLSDMPLRHGLDLITEAASMAGGSLPVQLAGVPFLVLHGEHEEARSTYRRLERGWHGPTENAWRCARWLNVRPSLRLIGLRALERMR